MLVGLAVFAAGTGLIFVVSLYLQEGLHASPRDASLGLVPLTLGLIAAGFAAMGGLVAKLGRTIVVIGLTVALAGCGWVLALVEHASLVALGPALFVIGIGLCFATIPPSLSATRALRKPAAPAARSARFSSSLRRSARPGSPRSSSRPQPPDWTTP